jgi:hypothetical protein
MKTSKTHYPSAFGFLLFALAALFVFVISIILGLSALLAYIEEGVGNVQSTIYSATFAFTGMLLGVVSIISLLRFMDKPFARAQVSTSFEAWKVATGIVGAGLVLLIGSWVMENQTVNWLVLPLLTIPAVMLPIWTLIGMATKDLSLDSRWRMWSTLGVSLTVTPFLSFILEALVVIAILFIVVLYAVVNPEAATAFEKLSTQFAYMNVQSEEALRLLTPYITKPVVVIPVMIFFSIIIPLLEELIKPLAVWLLARKLDSAAQGFALGALSGAGFAIWETFNVSGQTADWSILLFTRIGTGLLHITTSALMGGAIFMAIREKRYPRLFGTYLLAILLHGLWNASAVTTSFTRLMVTYNHAANYESVQWIATIGLAILATVMLTLLVTSNRRYRETMLTSTTEETSTTQNETTV